MTGNRSAALLDFRKKFRLDEYEIASPAGWRLSVRPGQITLGSMVLSVQSGATDFSALHASETAGLAEGLGIAERLARGVYGAMRINALCLMMQDPIVHFHIIPRYDRIVRRYGKDWKDADWPGPPLMTAESTGDSILEAIVSDLCEADM